MGISLGFGKQESENNSSFNQNIWDPQGQALQNMYGSVNGLFQGNMQAGGLNDPRNAPINESIGNQMGGGAYGNLNLGNRLMTSLDQSMNTPSASQGVMGI